MSKQQTTKAKPEASQKAARGEYRSIYVALIDDPDFQDLSAEARSIFFVLKLKLGLSGIGVFMEETLPRYTGNPSERVSRGLSELIEKDWLRVERNVFWLRNALKFDPSNPLASKNHTTHVLNHIATLPKLAIVNEFARYYGLEEPFEIEPKGEGFGKGSERVSEGIGIPDTVYRTPDVTTTVADATEAAPRGVTPIEAARAESGSTEQHAPPNSNPEEGPEPDELPAPESAKDARLRMNAIAAPLIREHLWLGKEPPLGATRKHPGWGMKRELNILAGLMKDHDATPEEIGAVVEYARPVLGFGPEEPLSALIFQVEGRRDRFRQVLEYARIRRAKEERLRQEREPKPAGNVRIQLHVA